MRRFAKRDLQRRVARAVWPMGFAMVAKPAASLAAVELTPHASASYEYESNPLYQWSGTAPHLFASSDYVLLLRGGGEARLFLSRQTLVVSAEVRRFDYRSLSYLARTEELFSGSWDWVLTPRVDGSAGYRHEHRMVPFDQLGTDREQLMETEDAVTASVNVLLPGAWRLQSRFNLRSLASPRPGLPDLSLRETSVHEGIRRLLRKNSLGLDAEYLSGSYHGADQLAARRYSQTTVQLAGERKVTNLSAFECAVGYTRRDDAVGGGVSALTGALRYQREITGKTSGEALLRRAVNSYVTSAGSEVDTTLALQLVWRPTGKIRARAGFTLTRSVYPSSGGDRRDNYQFMTVDIRYQVFDRLSIGPYARRAVRSSNLRTFGFDANAIGLELALWEAR